MVSPCSKPEEETDEEQEDNDKKMEDWTSTEGKQLTTVKMWGKLFGNLIEVRQRILKREETEETDKGPDKEKGGFDGPTSTSVLLKTT